MTLMRCPLQGVAYDMSQGMDRRDEVLSRAPSKSRPLATLTRKPKASGGSAFERRIPSDP